MCSTNNFWKNASTCGLWLPTVGAGWSFYLLTVATPSFLAQCVIFVVVCFPNCCHHPRVVYHVTDAKVFRCFKSIYSNETDLVHHLVGSWLVKTIASHATIPLILNETKRSLLAKHPAGSQGNAASAHKAQPKRSRSGSPIPLRGDCNTSVHMVNGKKRFA